MDVKDLRFFAAVYEAKSFSRAGQNLGTVQSNVSTRIRVLEQSLGGQLFERRYRGVVPTAKGERFYGQAKQLIEKFENVVREIKLELR